MTIWGDSVFYGAYSPFLKRELRPWDLRFRGYVNLTVAGADKGIRQRRQRMRELVVVGLGYNSNWERDRRNYKFWAGQFDRQALGLVRTLRRFGARRILWVTLREPDRSNVPKELYPALEKHAWYFPYVNERLRRLDRRREDVTIANFTPVADRLGITWDTIHLNPKGSALLARTIERGIDKAAGCRL